LLRSLQIGKAALEEHLAVLKGEKIKEEGDQQEKMEDEEKENKNDEKVNKEKEAKSVERPKALQSKKPERVVRAIARLEKRIQATENKLKPQDSKVSPLRKLEYSDPRITVAWCKKQEVPFDKFFHKSLLEKIPWAIEAPPSWRFTEKSTNPFKN